MIFQRPFCVLLAAALLLNALPLPGNAGGAPCPVLNVTATQALTAPAAWTLRTIEGISDWKARQWAPAQQYIDTHEWLQTTLDALAHMSLGLGMSLRVGSNESLIEVNKDIRSSISYSVVKPEKFLSENLVLFKTSTWWNMAALLPYDVITRQGSWDYKMAIVDQILTQQTSKDFMLLRAYVTRQREYRDMARLAITLIQVRRAEKTQSNPTDEFPKDVQYAQNFLPTESQIEAYPRSAELLVVRQELSVRLERLSVDAEAYVAAHKPPSVTPKNKKVEESAEAVSEHQALEKKWTEFRSRATTKPEQITGFFNTAAWKKQDPTWRLQRLSAWTQDWWNKRLVDTAVNADILRLTVNEIQHTFSLAEEEKTPLSISEAAAVHDFFIEVNTPASPKYVYIAPLYKKQAPSPLKKAIQTLAEALPSRIARQVKLQKKILYHQSHDLDERLTPYEIAVLDQRNPLPLAIFEMLRDAVNHFFDGIPSEFLGGHEQDFEAFHERLTTLEQHTVLTTNA